MEELLACPVCHEECAYMESEGDWCVWVECGSCGSHTAFQRYDNEEEKAAAEEKAAMLWNMGKVVNATRGE